MARQRLVFTGHIAGFGTPAGVRLVVGTWADSPFGAFADVMVQTADDERILLAPSAEVADFVASTYSFDRTEIGPVTAALTADRLCVNAARLQVDISAPLAPAVGFGFSSAPPSPQIVSVTTTVDIPASTVI